MQASEFFMFAALMFVDMLIFAVIAYFYKYVDVHKMENERKKGLIMEKEDIKLESRNNNNNLKGNDNDGYAGSTDF